MKTYRTKSNWDDDMRTHVPSCTIMAQEPVEKFSDLYDANGNKLYTVERCAPIGFIHFGGNQ